MAGSHNPYNPNSEFSTDISNLNNMYFPGFNPPTAATSPGFTAPRNMSSYPAINSAYCRWTDQETKSLLDVWKRHYPELALRKRTAAVWERITVEYNSQVGALGFSEKLTQQCKNRIKNLLDKYKEAKRIFNNITAASDKQTESPFFEIFEEVLGRDINSDTKNEGGFEEPFGSRSDAVSPLIEKETAVFLKFEGSPERACTNIQNSDSFDRFETNGAVINVSNSESASDCRTSLGEPCEAIGQHNGDTWYSETAEHGRQYTRSPGRQRYDLRRHSIGLDRMDTVPYQQDDSVFGDADPARQSSAEQQTCQSTAGSEPTREPSKKRKKKSAPPAQKPEGTEEIAFIANTMREILEENQKQTKELIGQLIERDREAQAQQQEFFTKMVQEMGKYFQKKE